MVVQDKLSDAEKLAKDMSITLRQGRWEPDPSVVAQRQAEFRKANEETANLQGKLGIVVVILITLMIVMSVVNMDAACFFPLLIVLMFGVIIAIVILVSNKVKPTPYIDWNDQYPIVKVDKTQVHLNDQQVDFSSMAGAEVDRYHNELVLLNKALKRRSIPFDAYKNVTEMVLALQGAIEANGVHVTDKYPEWNGPNALQRDPDIGKSSDPEPSDDQQEAPEDPWVVTPIEDELEKPLETKGPTEVKPVDIPITAPTVETKDQSGQVCSKCGARLNEDLIECPNCGSGF